MTVSGALLLCLVTAVGDGDSLTVDCSRQGLPRRLSVRVARIDAPEAGQPFGARSRQHLRGLCLGRTAAIRPVAVDTYGRTVASVRCGEADVGEAQLRMGLAWAYRPHGEHDPLLALQERARQARLGLWSAPRPIPPWQWRARDCEVSRGASQGHPG